MTIEPADEEPADDVTLMHWAAPGTKACHRCGAKLHPALLGLVAAGGPPAGLWWTVTGEVRPNGFLGGGPRRVLCPLSALRTMEVQQKHDAWRAENPPKPRRKKSKRPARQPAPSA